MSFSTQSPPEQTGPRLEQEQPRMVAVRPPVGRSLVTYAILGITIFVYILQELNRMGIAREPFLALSRLVFGQENLLALLANGWGEALPLLLGGRISEFIIAGQYWRLLTPALLHGSLQHIGANMISLFIIGQRMETFYGHRRFLGLYILSAIGGNVLSFLLTPGISVGASTAVFGLIAAEGVFAFQHRSLFGPQAREMLNNIMFLLILNLGIGLWSPYIDNWGHLGGLLVGLAFAWFAGPRLRVGYRHPDYVLEDQRSPASVWLVSAVVLLLLVLVVFFVIRF